jgi:hypothetical protein
VSEPPASGSYSYSLLALALSAIACDARPDRTTKLTPPVLTHATAASAAVPIDPAFVPLARAARDAATKVASTCQLHSEFAEEYRRYSDHCTFPGADVAALRTSAAALAAAPAPANGDALVFAEEVRLFTAWVDLVKDGNTPGTLSHYQGLAAAWNALQPGERIPVDLRTKDAYDGTVIVGGAGGKLAWVRCSTGPCLLVPRKDR